MRFHALVTAENGYNGSETTLRYTVIQVYRDIHTLTGYRAGVLFRYYRTGMQRAVLPPRSGTTVYNYKKTKDQEDQERKPDPKSLSITYERNLGICDVEKSEIIIIREIVNKF